MGTGQRNSNNELPRNMKHTQDQAINSSRRQFLKTTCRHAAAGIAASTTLAPGLRALTADDRVSGDGIGARHGHTVTEHRAGVNATPTVFINGSLLRQGNLKGFQTAIDKELQKLRVGAGKPAP